MWNYTEENACDTISLHDCRSDDMQVKGNDLIVNFPDGFWILPNSEHIDHDTPLKTGPSQLCFRDFDIFPIDLFRTTRLFQRPLFCRRIRVELSQLLKKANDGRHELEFLWEFHRPGNSLYQCWLWKKNHGMVAECQFEITASAIEYRWNEIRPDREW